MRSVYRMLLGLYPRAFRTRYRQELLEGFDAERMHPRHRRLIGALRLWRYLLADLVASAARQRWRANRSAVLELTGRGAPRLPHHSRRRLMETLVKTSATRCGNSLVVLASRPSQCYRWPSASAAPA